VSAPRRQPDVDVQQAASLLSSRYGVIVPPWRFPLLHAELERIGDGGGAGEGVGRLHRGDQEAWTRVVSLVAVAESYFFRHPGHFDALYRLGLELVRRGRPCRVLSAGCSTGEEAWSAAAVLASLPDPAAGQHRVTGWDLSEQRLRHARAGRYTQWACRRGFDRYGSFFHADDCHWSVAPELRSLVRFECLNLIADAFPQEQFEAVLFRNVSIYWDRETVARITGRLLAMLDVGGLLMVGPSDPVQLPDQGWEQRFEAGGARVYQRRAEGEERPARRFQTASGSPRAPESPARTRSAAARPESRRATVGGRRRGAEEARDRQALAAGPPPVSPPPAALEQGSNGDGVLLEVRALADRGEYEAALQLLQRSEVHEPAEASLWEGILLLNMGHLERAVASLRRCVFYEAAVPLYRRWLAVAYDAVGRTSEAAREHRNATELEGA